MLSNLIKCVFNVPKRIINSRLDNLAESPEEKSLLVQGFSTIIAAIALFTLVLSLGWTGVWLLVISVILVNDVTEDIISKALSN